MKSPESKIFDRLEISKKFQTEPKALKEIHGIREHLSKLPKEEINKRLKDIRRRYKQLLVS